MEIYTEKLLILILYVLERWLTLEIFEAIVAIQSWVCIAVVAPTVGATHLPTDI